MKDFILNNLLKIFKLLKNKDFYLIFSGIFFIMFFCKFIEPNNLDKIPYISYFNKLDMFQILFLFLFSVFIFFCFKYKEDIKKNDKYCIEILNNIEKYLHLNDWSNISDNAVCSIITEKISDNIYECISYIDKLYKPKQIRYIKFIKFIEILKNDFESYIETFHKCSFLRSGGSFFEDKSYKKYNDANTIDNIANKHEIWEKQCFYRLWNCVNSLNKLREKAIGLFGINNVPSSFKEKFLLVDSLGHTNDTKATSYFCKKRFVKELILIDDNFFNIDKDIKK